MSHSPIMDIYTYWISFLVDISTIPQQQFCAGAFTLYYPLDSEDNIMRATEKIEHERNLPSGSVTIMFWKRIG